MATSVSARGMFTKGAQHACEMLVKLRDAAVRLKIHLWTGRAYGDADSGAATFAEIKTGERRAIDYVLSPVRKIIAA